MVPEAVVVSIPGSGVGVAAPEEFTGVGVGGQSAGASAASASTERRGPDGRLIDVFAIKL